MYEEEDRPRDKDRRKGITLTTNVAVTALIGLMVQFGYFVYAMGRQSEKLDTVVIDVRDIKSTMRDAARDIGGLQRTDENHEARIRGLEIRVSQGR